MGDEKALADFFLTIESAGVRQIDQPPLGINLDDEGNFLFFQTKGGQPVLWIAVSADGADSNR